MAPLFHFMISLIIINSFKFLGDIIYKTWITNAIDLKLYQQIFISFSFEIIPILKSMVHYVKWEQLKGKKHNIAQTLKFSTPWHAIPMKLWTLVVK